VAGEDLDPLAVLVNLAAKTVQLRFDGATADLRDDLLGAWDPLAEGHADRIPHLGGDPGDGLPPSLARHLADSTEVRAEIVGAFEVGLELAAPHLRECQRFEDGRIPHAQAESPEDEPRDVLGLARRGARQKVRQIAQLLLDRAFPARASD